MWSSARRPPVGETVVYPSRSVLSCDDGQMNDEGSAAVNPEHEDDRIERRIADQPETRPHRWVNRIVLVLVGIGVAYVIYLVSAAFFPRWWAQRVADQVDGRFSAGVLWGLFYGFVFSFIPVLILFQARRGLFNWVGKLVVAGIAVALAAPNWLTLSVVAGNSNAAHAGERIMDVDAPAFRAATLIAVLVGVGLGLLVSAMSIAMKRRKHQVERLRGERDELRRSREDHDDTE
jgi:hypothetical protein